MCFPVLGIFMSQHDSFSSAKEKALLPDSILLGSVGADQPFTEQDRTRMREKRHRVRELCFAVALLFIVALVTILELQYFGEFSSVVFIGLFNVNLILLIVVVFVVIRNLVKLILERRRNVLGSRLRVRLVIAFLALSIVPTVVMFVLGSFFIRTSVDFWFKTQVEQSLEQALQVGQAFYTSSQERLKRRSGYVLQGIREREFAWGGKAMNTFLQEKQKEYDFGLIGVMRPDGKVQNWHTDALWDEIWKDTSELLTKEGLATKTEFWSIIRPSPEADVVIGIMPVDKGKTGYLVIGESIGHGLLFKLDRIVQGINEYKEIRTLKRQWKLALYMLLAVVTLLIVLGAIWFGMRLAKELTVPVQALAEGTQRVARGDLSVRLKDESSDELGFLVKSFNSMAFDLQQGRASLSRQNQELEARGQYIEALLNNITAGVISLDGEGYITTVNQAAEAMFALQAEQLLGKKPTDFLHGGYLSMLSEAVNLLMESPSSQWQRQLDLSVKGRDKKILINCVALRRENDTRGIVIVFEDITELNKMQRVEAWREVARRIAHEIKNPLTPIKLSAQRIERRFAGDIKDPVFTQCTELIVRQVEHMQEMVKEFSAFAKLPEVDLRMDDIASLLKEVVDTFKLSHSDIIWELIFETTLPRIRMDRESIRRMLVNLLTNAAEVLAGQKDAKVVITASHELKGGGLRLEIKDNGTGLSREEQSRLFEPYFSHKKGGTGLGLTIVKSIVSDHHGYIRAVPGEEKGTSFVIELPV